MRSCPESTKKRDAKRHEKDPKAEQRGTKVIRAGYELQPLYSLFMEHFARHGRETSRLRFPCFHAFETWVLSEILESNCRCAHRERQSISVSIV